jgi:hypothetical protein
MTILIIWAVIIFGAIGFTLFAIGSSFGGWKGGMWLVIAALLQVTFYGGVITLGYYTIKEIGKHI